MTPHLLLSLSFNVCRQVSFMRPPRYSIRFLLTAILGITAIFGTLTATRDRIANRSNYDRIRLGMTRGEVDQLLGEPSVDSGPLNYVDVTFHESGKELLITYPPPHTLRTWKGDRYLISVIFDKHDRVGAKYYKRTPQASTLDRFADWLGM